MKFIDQVKKFLAWLWEEDPNPKFSYQECRILPLRGRYFNDGFCLGDYSYENSKRTKLGKLIYNFKYKGDKKAGDILSNLLTELIKTRLNPPDILVTVPPAVVSRVFQPTSYLTEIVSLFTGIPWNKGLIVRTRQCGMQKKLSRMSEKVRNVANLFQLEGGNKVKGKKVLVLDDIYDSGATVNEICRVLKSKGAYYIGVVTLAKTGFDQYGLP
jgi:ComF family protein